MQSTVMGSASDKISGVANEAIGNVKQVISKAVGSEKLQAEILMQEAKGDVHKSLGEAKDGIKDAANKTADAINKKL